MTEFTCLGIHSEMKKKAIIQHSTRTQCSVFPEQPMLGEDLCTIYVIGKN